MNEYDYFIENYFVSYFEDMTANLISRDYRLEKMIEKAGKYEYLINKALIQKTNIPSSVKNIYDRNDINSFNFSEYNRCSKSLFELFDISQRNSEYFLKLPLMSYYCFCHQIGIEQAIDLLYKEFGNCDIELGKTEIFWISNSSHNQFNGLFLREFVFCEDGFKIGYIFVKYLKTKKILIPGFNSNLLKKEFSFLPSCNENLLYNAQYLNYYPEATVILTDSIELAGINQQILNKFECKDIIWLSFYGEEKYVGKIDWSVLDNRRVYYLIKEHSGFGTETIFKILDTVVESVYEKCMPYELKYISYLQNYEVHKEPQKYSEVLPLILSHKQLKEKRNPVVSTRRVIQSFRQFTNDVSGLYVNQKPILEPLIFERTTTLFYGQVNCPTSLFATQISFGVSQGMNPFKGWLTGRVKTPVLYLKGEVVNVEIFRHLVNTLSVYATRKNVVVKPDCNIFNIEEIKNTPSEFPGINSSPEFIPDNFFWNIIDLELDKSINIEDGIIKYINVQTQLFQEKFKDKNKLLVLDNLLDDIDKDNLNRINFILRKLHEFNWAIMVISKCKGRLEKVIKFDNVLKVSDVNEKNQDNLQFSVTIEKNFQTMKKTDKNFVCEADFESKNPFFKRKIQWRRQWPVALTIPREELMVEIRRLLGEGFTTADIAEKFEISESLVKKIKGELGLSKKRMYKNYKTPF